MGSGAMEFSRRESFGAAAAGVALALGSATEARGTMPACPSGQPLRLGRRGHDPQRVADQGTGTFLTPVTSATIRIQRF